MILNCFDIIDLSYSSHTTAQHSTNLLTYLLYASFYEMSSYFSVLLLLHLDRAAAVSRSGPDCTANEMRSLIMDSFMFCVFSIFVDIEFGLALKRRRNYKLNIIHWNWNCGGIKENSRLRFKLIRF